MVLSNEGKFFLKPRISHYFSQPLGREVRFHKVHMNRKWILGARKKNRLESVAWGGVGNYFLIFSLTGHGFHLQWVWPKSTILVVFRTLSTDRSKAGFGPQDRFRCPRYAKISCLNGFEKSVFEVGFGCRGSILKILIENPV